MRNPYSLVTKLLLSPFFNQLPLTHYERDDEALLQDTYVLTDMNVRQFQAVDAMRSPSQSTVHVPAFGMT